MVGFTDYQRHMWFQTTFIFVCRFYIVKTKNGSYAIKEVGALKKLFYFLIWVNTGIKLIYLTFTYHGWIPVEVHFLDQMSMWDWYLNAMHLVAEASIWIRKYPHYEILHRQWALLEEIYQKLESPQKISDKIQQTDRINKLMYSTFVIVGTVGLLFQEFSTPKYALNTYAIIPFENFPLTLLFSMHECIFMFQAYIHQASTMIVAECKSTSYAHILAEMTETVHKLIREGKPHKEVKIVKNDPGEESDTYSGKNVELPQDNGTRNSWKIKDRYLDPKTKAPGTEYDIETLIRDYRKLTLMSKEYNSWVGKRMGYCEGLNYCQFVSDVFMIFQLIKEPEMDFLGIFFYLLDAIFGMIMLFRMLILTSRLYPQSQEFLHALKCYTQYETPLRNFLRKTISSFRIIATKLTGYSVQPKSVPVGVNVLMNWYICAAMWKRPIDPTRRN